jgi:hypothetical protein
MNTAESEKNTSADEVPKPKRKRAPAKKAKPAKKAARAKKPASKPNIESRQQEGRGDCAYEARQRRNPGGNHGRHQGAGNTQCCKWQGPALSSCQNRELKIPRATPTGWWI